MPDTVRPPSGRATTAPAMRRTTDEVPSATKRSMLAVSRALESLASRAAGAGAPLAVVALFEDAEYFAFERDRYARLARTATVVVGFVGDAPPLPHGVELLALDDGHVLAAEWSVLVLSPLGSGGMVSIDLLQLVPELSLERGRLFSPELSTDPHWVADQVERIVAAAGDLLDPAVATRLRQHVVDVVGRRAALPERILREALLSGWQRLVTSMSSLDRVEQLALTDPLTGAYNRRFLERYLTRLGPRAPVLAVIAFDFDRFKQVNDTWGHSAGDAALRCFAAVARQRSRPTDVLVRLGGDEWLLLLPGLDEAAAVARAEDILLGYARTTLPSPADQVVLSASAGVGVFPAATLDLEAVDRALYVAKGRGGGEVAAAGAQVAAAGAS